MVQSLFIRLLFFLTFLILFVGRIIILKTGFIDDSDEIVFYYTIENIYELLKFDPVYWAKATFHLDYFKGEVFLRAFQMLFIIPIANFLDLPLNHFKVAQLSGFFNVISSVLSIFIVYKILVRFKIRLLPTILSIFIYGSLINTNLYVRHFLPYENSFVLHLIAFYFILTKEHNAKNLFLSGLVFSIAFTTYFGYFMFLFINLAVLLWKAYDLKFEFKKLVKNIFIFYLPLTFLVFAFEIIGNIAIGKSYFEHVLDFSTTIYHGSYDEGLIYPFIYFHLVEKYFGLVVLFATIFSSIFALVIEVDKTLKIVIIIFIVAFLAFGINSVFFEGMVFYGRTFRMFYILIPVSISVVINKILCESKWKNILKGNLKYIFFALVYILTFFNYTLNIQELNALGYPRTEIYKNSWFPSTNGNVNVNHVYELQCSDLVYDPSSRFIHGINPDIPSGDYTLINFCFLNHVEDFMDHYKPLNLNQDNIVFRKKHFMCYPAYTFEYCTREGREFFLNNDIYLTVLKD